ncbi:hypothetical protein CU098_008436, partial [Rhizopus stolonifer]
LRYPVFAHGQNYVAFSRSTNFKNITVLLDEENQEERIENVPEGLAVTAHDEGPIFPEAQRRLEIPGVGQVAASELILHNELY